MSKYLSVLSCVAMVVVGSASLARAQSTGDGGAGLERNQITKTKPADYVATQPAASPAPTGSARAAAQSATAHEPATAAKNAASATLSPTKSGETERTASTVKSTHATGVVSAKSEDDIKPVVRRKRQVERPSDAYRKPERADVERRSEPRQSTRYNLGRFWPPVF